MGISLIIRFQGILIQILVLKNDRHFFGIVIKLRLHLNRSLYFSIHDFIILQVVFNNKKLKLEANHKPQQNGDQF